MCNVEVYISEVGKGNPSIDIQETMSANVLQTDQLIDLSHQSFSFLVSLPTRNHNISVCTFTTQHRNLIFVLFLAPRFRGATAQFRSAQHHSKFLESFLEDAPFCELYDYRIGCTRMYSIIRIYMNVIRGSQTL